MKVTIEMDDIDVLRLLRQEYDNKKEIIVGTLESTGNIDFDDFVQMLRNFNSNKYCDGIQCTNCPLYKYENATVGSKNCICSRLEIISDELNGIEQE